MKHIVKNEEYFSVMDQQCAYKLPHTTLGLSKAEIKDYSSGRLFYRYDPDSNIVEFHSPDIHLTNLTISLTYLTEEIDDSKSPRFFSEDDGYHD